MKKILFILALIPTLAQAQFLDAFTLFKPKVSVKGDYLLPSNDGFNNTTYGGTVGIFAPIKTDIKVKMDWKKVLKIRKLSDLKKIPSIDAKQVFGRMQLGYSEVDNELPFMGNHQIGFGSFGLTWFRLRSSPKLKLTVTSLNVTVSEDINMQSAIPNILFLHGKMKVLDLKHFMFIGFAAGNFNKLPFASPVIAYSGSLSDRWQLTVVLPVQAKITCKVAHGFRQSGIIGIGGYSTGITLVRDTIQGEERFFMSVFQLRAGTQSNISLGKKAKLYLEGGYAFGNVLRYRGYNDLRYVPQPSPYVRLALHYSFAKGLFNSDTFEIDF